MRTFVLRARKCSTDADRLLKQRGTDAHPEIIAHTVSNAFYVSQGMRRDVEVFIVFDSTADFPRTLHLSANDDVSFPGFDESSILTVVSNALHQGRSIRRDEALPVASGITVLGYGFEALMKRFIGNRPVYLLEPEGEQASTLSDLSNPVFILSDHLDMPKKTVKGLERKGVALLSLGSQMLFASHCVTLLHYELDRRV
jgi:tRNA (pseudouridine54-N1)-methyltransferase